MQHATDTAPKPRPFRPGLYHVVLEPNETDDIYAPSHGVILQYKSSFGYFTLPGPSRTCMAYMVDTAPDGTALVEFPVEALRALGATLSTQHAQRIAKPYWPKRSRYEREKDGFWSKVATLRAKGEDVRHMFGAVKTLTPPVRAEFRPAVSDLVPQPMIEVEIVEVYRPNVGWVPVGRR